LAIWYSNPLTGKKVLANGYVAMITSQLLEIETDDEDHMMLLLRADDFVTMDPADAPDALKAIAKETYNFGIRFKSGICCLLANRTPLE
jgi:hypothetical protein